MGTVNNSAFIYVASSGGALHKVGHSVDPKIRCRAISDALQIDFEISYTSDCLSVSKAREIEQIVHQSLDQYRIVMQYTTEIYETNINVIREAIAQSYISYSNGERAFDTRTRRRKRSHPDDLVNIQTIISSEDHLRLKKLSLLTGRSLQSLGIEAWSLLLAKEGEDSLADTKMNRSSGLRGRRPAR